MTDDTVTGKVVFVLMEEDYGGMFSSHLQPIGKAVTTEEAARQWVSERGVCDRAFSKVVICESVE